MNLEQRLRRSLVAPDPGAAFTAKVMARVARGRAPRNKRLFLFGAVLVAGVAAAMLAWRTADVRPTPTDAVVNSTTTDPAPVAAEPVAQALPVAGESLAPPSTPDLPLAASPRFSVLVMPLRLDAQDVMGRGQVEAFYSSMLEELHKLPGIALQMTGGSADYVLTIATPAPVRSDGTPGLTLNNRLSGFSVNVGYDIDPVTGKQRRGETISFEGGGLGGAGSVVWIEMRVEPRGESAFRYTFPIGVEGSSAQSQCAVPDAGLKAECLTPAQLAARQLEKLRMQVFPPDAALQLRLVARLTAPGMTQAQQLQVLQDLLISNSLAVDGMQGRTTRLDVATLRALTGRMATLPAPVRAQIWKMLRKVSQPELLAPLVDSLRRDTDQQVRREALATLKANFAAEPAFKAALESVAQTDPDQLVRIAARRELYGTAQWRSDVLAIVDNPGLSYEGRLAPLREMTDAVSSQLHELMQDQQVLRKVVELVREHLGDPDHAQPTFEVLVLLSNVRDPLVSDLFAEAMSKGIQTRQSGSGAVTMIDGRFVSGSGQKGDAPFVPTNLLDRMQEVTQGAKPAGQ